MTAYAFTCIRIYFILAKYLIATVQHTQPPMLPGAQREPDAGHDHRRVRDLRPRPD